MTSKQIEEAALSLPLAERAQLTDKLLSSLHHPASRGLDDAWVDEADRRMAAFRRGEMPDFDADDVLRELRARPR